MASISLAGYRKQWPRVGGVLAMAAGGALALTSDRLKKHQALSVANLGALFVHQYEEYVDPGWFPGQFNHGVLKSDRPRNYPLNEATALCVNTVFAYPFYVAPILFPKKKWLGLAPAIFGMSQAIGHGIIFPRLSGDKYSPGFLASFFLHVPIGITYIAALKHEEGLTRGDVVKGVAYTVGFAVVAIGGPNVLGANKNSPYAFSKKQMGPHDVEPADDDAPSPDA